MTGPKTGATDPRLFSRNVFATTWVGILLVATGIAATLISLMLLPGQLHNPAALWGTAGIITTIWGFGLTLMAVHTYRTRYLLTRRIIRALGKDKERELLRRCEDPDPKVSGPALASLRDLLELNG